MDGVCLHGSIFAYNSDLSLGSGPLGALRKQSFSWRQRLHCLQALILFKTEHLVLLERVEDSTSVLIFPVYVILISSTRMHLAHLFSIVIYYLRNEIGLKHLRVKHKHNHNHKKPKKKQRKKTKGHQMCDEMEQADTVCLFFSI